MKRGWKYHRLRPRPLGLGVNIDVKTARILAKRGRRDTTADVITCLSGISKGGISFAGIAPVLAVIAVITASCNVYYRVAYVWRRVKQNMPGVGCRCALKRFANATNA